MPIPNATHTFLILVIVGTIVLSSHDFIALVLQPTRSANASRLKPLVFRNLYIFSATLSSGRLPYRLSIKLTSLFFSIFANVALLYTIAPHEFATIKDIVFLTPDGFTRVKKTMFHEANRNTKFREGIKKIFNGIKSFFPSCFSWAKRNVWSYGGQV